MGRHIDGELPAARTRLVAELHRAATSLTSEGALLDLLARRLAEAMGDAAGVLLVDDATDRLRLAASHAVGAGGEALVRALGAKPWPTSEGLFTGLDREHGRVVRAHSGPGADPGASDELEGLGANTLVAVPIRVDGRPVGVVAVARMDTAAPPFDEEDAAFLAETVGDGYLLREVRVRGERVAATAVLERRATRASVLAEFLTAVVSATDERVVFDLLASRTAETLGVVCVIYRVTPDRRSLDVVGVAGYDAAPTASLPIVVVGQALRAGEGIAGTAFARGERILHRWMDASDQASYLGGLSAAHRAGMAGLDMRAVVGLPLAAAGTPIGAITLSRHGPDARPLDDDDVSFAEALAERAGAALSTLALLADRERTADTLTAVFEAVPLATYTLDADGRVELWNRAAEDLFGYPAAEAVGKPLPPTVGAEDDAAAARFGARVGPGGIVRGVASSRTRSDGSTVEVELYGASITGADGRPRLLSMAADVTERNELQRAVHETSETLRAILDASPLPMMVVDLRRRVTFWNAASERLYGWSAAEALGQPPPYLIPDEPDPLAPLLPDIAAGGTIVLEEVRRATKSGEIIPVRLFAAPVFDENGKVAALLGIHEDLRVRRELEATLRETSETLTAILDASPLAIIAVDAEGRVTFWSRAAERMYGWSAEESLGRLPPHIPGDPSATLAHEFQRFRAGEPEVILEGARHARDGRALDVIVHLVPLHDANGALTGMLSIQEDVTERRRLEADLAQSQKMETVGRLAGGVAHDFNNILTAIIGFAALAQDWTREPPTADALRDIRMAAERAASLTQQLLAFSRRQILHPAVVDVNEVVHGVETMLRRLIGEHVDLLVSTRAGVGSVLVDRTQFEQVILNLAINARDAMPNGGRLVIGTDVTVFGDDNPHVTMEPGEYAVLSVTDTGVGMDEETRARAFEPFFTTKEPGKGTGLGLATVYGIVRQSGGHVWVYSEPGRGTTFRIYVPRVGGSAHPVTVAAPVRERSSEGVILLVEDEPLLRELGGSILARDGFVVHKAATPAEALTLVEELPPVDVLVSDVIMPGITGVQLAQRMREARPDLAVVLMSGYAEDVADISSVADVFLPKPFTPATLTDAVRRVLGDGEG